MQYPGTKATDTINVTSSGAERKNMKNIHQN